MAMFGYKLIATSDYGVNAFFIKDKFSNLFLKSGKLGELYQDSNNLFTNWNRRGPSQFMTTAKSLLDQ
jgi:hypothetical protein